MRSVLLLRIASALTFIHAVLHTIGGVFGKTDPGPASVAVDAMKANEFLWQGHMHSFWAFYRGLGLGITVSLTMEAIVMWQLSSLAREDVRRLRPILLTFALGYVVLAVNSNTYFFIGPVIVEILIAACLVGACFSTRPPALEHAS